MQSRTILIVAGFVALLCAGTASSQELFQYQHEETRWATAENPSGAPGVGGKANGGRKGSPSIGLNPGETVTLAQADDSSGTVRRIWLTLSDRSPSMLRGLRIQCYWDGAVKPAVDVPLGDFFSVPLGLMSTFESALFSSPEGRSLNSFVPMPFRKSMRIVLINESGKRLGNLFYEVDYTLGDQHGSDMLYLHAWYHNQNPTTLKQDFEMLPKISGRGRLLGVSVGVIANKERYLDAWWGEGEMKIYTDGDTALPTLNGTGTEDYIGSGWGMQRFTNPYEGCTLADDRNMRFGFYRWHIPDPIYFAKDIRVTMQQIGGGTMTPALYKLASPVYSLGPGLVERQPMSQGLFEREDDWSSSAFFYLDKPDDDLPPLEPAASRLKEVSAEETP